MKRAVPLCVSKLKCVTALEKTYQFKEKIILVTVNIRKLLLLIHIKQVILITGYEEELAYLYHTIFLMERGPCVISPCMLTEPGCTNKFP